MASNAKGDGLGAIFFPGWAMPSDAGLVRKLLPSELDPVEVAEYGFFSGDDPFDFRHPDREIAKFAEKRHNVVVGYSLGSQFALRLALHCRPKALVIISGFAKFADSDDNPDGQKSSGVKAMIGGMRIQPSKVLREFYRISIGSAKSAFDSDSLIPAPSAMIAGLEYLLHCDLRRELAKLDVPLLVLAGEDDTVVKASLSKKLADAVNGAKFVCAKGVGHSLPFSRTAETRKEIHGFLRENNIL